jgi:autotransporter translocation and assembly factor TamB
VQEPPQEPIGTGPDGPEVAATPAAPVRPLRGRKRRFAKRWSRRFSIIAIALFAALIVTLVTVDIGRVSIGGQSIKTLAEKYASRYLNRPMHIGQVIAQLKVGHFEFRDVVIEGPTPNDRPFFAAKRIVVDIPWWLTIGRELDLDVDIYDWRMVVEKFPDGQTKLPKFTSGGSGGPPKLKVQHLAIYCHNGEFVYDDHVAPWRVVGPNLNFSLVRANNLGTFYGLASFSKGTVQIQNFEPLATDFSTRFQLKGKVVDLKHIDLLTDGAESHISGYVDFGNWPDQEYKIQSTVDFNRMRELFFSKVDWRMSGKGQFNGIFRIPKNGQFDLSGMFKSDEAGLGIRNSEWRFGNLDGELQWTQHQFIVKRADTDFLGGRMKLAYALDGLSTPAGANASLKADYNNVDLYLFTRQFGWTALEPQARLRGTVAMDWHNGQFTETMGGQGSTQLTAPAGAALATELLPSSAPPQKPDVQFQKFRPFGGFPISGDTTYRFSGGTLDFSESWVATPSTFVRFSGHARGGDTHVPFHVTSHDWQTSDRLFSAIMTNFNHPTGAIEVSGRGTFDGTLTKAFNAPRIEGHFTGDRMHAWNVMWGKVTGDIAIENSYLDLTNGRIDYGESGLVTTSGRYALGYPRPDGGDEINATIHAVNMPLSALRPAFGLEDWPVEGTLAAADLTLTGRYEKPAGSGTMRLENGLAWSEPFDVATSDLRFGGDGSVSLQRVVVAKGTGRVTGDAHLGWADDTFSISAASDGLPIQELATFRFDKAPLSGQLRFKARGSGSFDAPTWEVSDLVVPDLYAGDEGVGDLGADLELARGVLTVKKLSVSSVRLKVDCQGTVQVSDLYPASLHCGFTNTSLDPYFKFVGQDLPFNRAIVTGNVNASGPLKDTSRLAVGVRIDDASLTLFDYQLKNLQPIDLAFHDNTFWLDHVGFQGEGTQLQLTGQANLTSRTIGVQAQGRANLAVLQAFYPAIGADGTADLTASMTGTFEHPEVTGRANLAGGYIRAPGLPGLSDVNGRITVAGGRITVDGVTGVMGEGPVVFGGSISLDGYRPSQFDLRATGTSLHLRYPEGLHSTVEADLRLQGPVSAPVLRGDVTVLRATYAVRFQEDPRGYFGFFGGSDQAAVGGAVAADVHDPSPVTLAVRIRAGLMPFVDNKATDAYIVGSANIDVTGTLDDPKITGRVVIDHGNWAFGGNRYSLLGGSIDFSNPARFDPFFDLTAETNARAPGQTYHVTVRITGTLDSFSPTVSSEPWLSEMQIVSLLMGEAPNPNTVELRALNSSQEEQAKALSSVGVAIITSPISATVGSVIQRTTTLNAQIVPLLGTESTLQQLNPTARIVLGRRISNRVYLTYSRTLSGTQNEIILVEVEQSDRVSWVLSRNEDKTFALDFRFRYVVR